MGGGEGGEKTAYPRFILLQFPYNNFCEVAQQAATLSIKVALLPVNDAPAGQHLLNLSNCCR